MFAFIVIPVLDLLIGEDSSNATAEQLRELEKKQSFRLVALGFVPVQVALVIWVAFVASQVELTAFELAGFLLSVGITTGGIGITVAHELFHKKSRLDTFSGKILLLMVCYMHFYIEHLMKKWRRRTPGMLTIASPITFCFVCSATPTTISIRCVLTRFCAISTRARNSRQATQA